MTGLQLWLLIGLLGVATGYALGRSPQWLNRWRDRPKAYRHRRSDPVCAEHLRLRPVWLRWRVKATRGRRCLRCAEARTDQVLDRLAGMDLLPWQNALARDILSIPRHRGKTFDPSRCYSPLGLSADRCAPVDVDCLACIAYRPVSMKAPSE